VDTEHQKRIGGSGGELYAGWVSHKRAKILQHIAQFQGQGLDAHYLGYFACFNHQLFFEAHEVLEQLWLSQRGAVNGAWYKGLIQLAGAFVHLQKGRLRPAAALFKLAETNLASYPATHEQLSRPAALALIDSWTAKLEAGDYKINPLEPGNAPRLELIGIPLAIERELG
jgi:predicted metal-dependent hydrolase